MAGLDLAASVIAVIDLSAQVASSCSWYYDKVKNARDEIQRLRRETQALNTTLESVYSLFKGPHGVNIRGDQGLLAEVEDCKKQLDQLDTKLKPREGNELMTRWGMRALKWPLKSKQVDQIMKRLGKCNDSITLSLLNDQEVHILSMHQEIFLGKLPSVDNAAFDSHDEEHNARCYGDTRVELLRQIYNWANDVDSEYIFWLNGMAGTGKSTISRTIAKNFEERRELGASFFFKRGESDRGHVKALITTIASQLVRSLPFLAPHVQNAIEADPGIPHKTLGRQFDTLILQPLGKIQPSLPRSLPVIIVIDALDECDREEDIKTLVRLLPRVHSITTVQLKFFLTSRPELPIRLGFKNIEGSYEHFALHRISEPLVKRDISAFLEHKLGGIRDEYNKSVLPDRHLSMSWPKRRNVQQLVGMAVPLFIFATTICRFIEDRRCGEPQEQLEKILEYQTKSQESKLDATYLPIPDQLTSGLSKLQTGEVVQKFQEVVGSIVMLASPLSANSLARLLEISKARVDSMLDLLHSVLSVPLNTETPIRLFHLSFRDFLLDAEKREKHPFWVDEKSVHQRLMTKCLDCLCQSGYLKRDICNFRTPEKPRADIDQQIVDAHLPPEIQYACQYWVYHTREGGTTLCDNDQVNVFLERHFLHWLEALSLIGRMSESISMINDLISMLNSSDTAKVSAFLYDAKRFILNFHTITVSSPLQLYSSALVFAPERTVIRHTFQDNVPKWISLRPKVEVSWNATLQTLEGHSGSVTSTAFSHDSKVVASASGDKTVRLWDAATGSFQQTLEGHSRRVASVAFSHDSTLLASASDDKTVRLWDAATGSFQQLLEGHSDRVTAVAFSHDSRVLASASDDKTVRRWDVATGSLQQTIVVDGYISTLSFDITNSALITNIGSFNLDSIETPPSLISCADPGVKSNRESLGISDSWVTWNGRNVLWLPPDFRARVSDISITGSILAIGSVSGKGLIIGFSFANLHSFYCS